MDKIDCVVSFYRRELLWPKVAMGLEQNAQHLRKVFVVNDEPWKAQSKEAIVAPGMDIVFLDHPHEDAFGLARSNNQGIEAAETEYVLVLDDDIVLAPNALAKLLPMLQPKRLVYGRLGDALSDTEFTKDKGFWRTVPKLLGGEGREKNQLDVLLHGCNGGFFITHKPSHDHIGGYDEVLVDRGWLDTNYALRWLLAYGPESVVIGSGGAWHLHVRGEHPKRGATNEQIAIQLYNNVLAAYPDIAVKRHRT